MVDFNAAFGSEESFEDKKRKLREEHEYARLDQELTLKDLKQLNDLKKQLKLEDVLKLALGEVAAAQDYIDQGRYGQAERILQLNMFAGLMPKDFLELLRTGPLQKLHWRRASDLARKSQHDEIIRLLRSLPDKLHTPTSYFYFANALYMQREVDQAASVISKAIHEYTDDPDYYDLKSKIWLDIAVSHADDIMNYLKDGEAPRVIDKARIRLRDAQDRTMEALAAAYQIASDNPKVVFNLQRNYDALKYTDKYYSIDDTPLRMLGFFAYPPK